MATYPATLPLAQKEGYVITPTSGVLKTAMTSGTARQRRIIERPPTNISVKWIYSIAEFAVFEAWYLHEAKMGAEWFEIDLLAGLGLVKHTARFTDEGYKAPFNKRSNKFEVTAVLETELRPVLSKGSLALTLIYGIEDLNKAASRLKTCVHNTFNKL